MCACVYMFSSITSALVTCHLQQHRWRLIMVCVRSSYPVQRLNDLAPTIHARNNITNRTFVRGLTGTGICAFHEDIHSNYRLLLKQNIKKVSMCFWVIEDEICMTCILWYVINVKILSRVILEVLLFRSKCFSIYQS